MSVLLIVLMVAGCGVTSESSGTKSSQLEQDRQAIEKLVAQIDNGEWKIERFAEESCLGAGHPHPETNVTSIVWMKKPVAGSETFSAIAQGLHSLLLEEGAEKFENENNPNGTGYLVNDLRVSVDLQEPVSDGAVDVIVSGACRDAPEGYTMHRDPRDPSYGDSDPRYGVETAE